MTAKAATILAFRLGYDEQPKWFRAALASKICKLVLLRGAKMVGVAVIGPPARHHRATEGDWVLMINNKHLDVMPHLQFIQYYTPNLDGTAQVKKKEH